MLRLLKTLILMAPLTLGGIAAAQDRPVVLELFTSQGCSSCPPADAMLHEFAKHPDVIALALHVDYWDYIGWKDIFADPSFTKRQRAYAASQGERMVYTPQLMINGVQHVAGNRKSDVQKAVRSHKNAPAILQVAASKAGSSVKINLSASTKPTDMVIHLVSYRPKSKVNITRGENAGKTITYANVVTNWRTLERWNGHKAKTVSATLKGKGPWVVLVQKRGHGEVLAAARVK